MHVALRITAHLGYGKEHTATGYRIPSDRQREADILLFAGTEHVVGAALVVIEVKKPGNVQDPQPQAKGYAQDLKAPLYATCAPGPEGLVWALYRTEDDQELFRADLANLEARWGDLERQMHRAVLLARYSHVRPLLSAWESQAANWERTYREEIQAQLGSVHLFGRQPINLGEVYVPVRLALVEQQVRLEVSNESDLERVARLMERQPDRSHSRYPEDWLRQQARLVIIGDPGAGKTTLLRHLSLQLAAGNIADREGLIPCYVPLNELFKKRHDRQVGIIDFFWDYLRQKAKEWGIAAQGDLWFQEMLKQGRVVLLWDGLDEVTGYADQPGAAAGAMEEAFELIRHLGQVYRDASVWVTCRRGA